MKTLITLRWLAKKTGSKFLRKLYRARFTKIEAQLHKEEEEMLAMYDEYMTELSDELEHGQYQEALLAARISCLKDQVQATDVLIARFNK